MACAALAICVSCSTPEKPLEFGRQYTSIVYADTEAETFGRTDRSVTGVVVDRYGDSVRFHIHTKPDALVSSVDFVALQAPRRGGRTMKKSFDLPKGTMPLFENSVAFLEQLLRRARALGGDTVRIPVMFVGASAFSDEFTVVRNGDDSVLLVPRVGHLASALRLAVDSVGHITGGMIPVSGTQIFSTPSP
ncbi:MAG TPA: hypothetical protein VH113_09795 [Gemmatimonadales bacterium]|jgi:hypothetical protein|nr:hypothetical protein [Gemmatimonadales bacterium]